MKRYIDDILSMIFILIVLYIVCVYSIGCAHIQEMHPLQVQTSIASVCWKDRLCVYGVKHCFDDRLAQYYSSVNQSEKGFFCGYPSPEFDEAKTIESCAREYRASHEEFK